MYFHKMNRLKENEQFSVLLSIGQQNDHFQGISCIRFQRSFTVHSDCMKYCRITDFTEEYQFFQPNALPFGVIT